MSSDAFRLLLPAGALPSPTRERARDAQLAREPDECLLQLTARGEADAFQHLVGRYEARLQHFVRWYAGERDGTDDIVQDILLQAFRSAGSFRGNSTVRTWLYAVARNVCGTYQRDRLQRGEHVMLDDAVFARMPDLTVDPLARLERDRTIAAVRAAVDGLPLDARLVLTLRDWEHMSYAEIAEVAGVPVGTVRSRLHNARARLAIALTERGYSR